MAEHCMGNLFIVAAPSGGGKTSLVKKLVSELNHIEISISHTTRAKRPGEQHGVDYFFIDESTFHQMVKENQFVEHAHVFNHLYGTSIAQIQDRLQAGLDIVLDIDWQGAQQIKYAFPEAVSIFILPPSLNTLQQRLLDRRQDNEDIVQSRMQRAQDEMSHFAEFDYLIVNDDFEKAASYLSAIVTAERHRMNRQAVQQRNLLSFLLATK